MSAPPSTVERGWWGRNRLWVILLVPLLLVALAASSQRFINYYLPWQLRAPQKANAEGIVEFHQTYRGAHVDHERRVTMRLLEATPTDVVEEAKAAPGGQMWRVMVQFTAEPDQVLLGCEVMLYDGKDSYGVTGAKVSATDDPYFTPDAYADCDPDGIQGPSYLPYTDELLLPDTPRPATWVNEYGIVLPHDVKPDALRIWFVEPQYALFPIK